mmetsp:Transcript_11400/g.17145  ORF Transcript_11400/g.17145 Transcript_11400/m.17145 type:complete len:83 (-) Transcript_11400:194-442(-)
MAMAIERMGQKSLPGTGVLAFTLMCTAYGIAVGLFCGCSGGRSVANVSSGVLPAQSYWSGMLPINDEMKFIRRKREEYGGVN